MGLPCQDLDYIITSFAALRLYMIRGRMNDLIYKKKNTKSGEVYDVIQGELNKLIVEERDLRGLLDKFVERYL